MHTIKGSRNARQPAKKINTQQFITNNNIPFIIKTLWPSQTLMINDSGDTFIIVFFRHCRVPRRSLYTILPSHAKRVFVIRTQIFLIRIHNLSFACKESVSVNQTRVSMIRTLACEEAIFVIQTRDHIIME